MARITSADLLTAFLLMQIRTALASFAVKGKLLTFVQLGVHRAQASGKPFSSQSASSMIWYMSGTLPQVPDSGIPIFELHKAVVGPFLPPAEWQQNPLVYLTHSSVLYYQETC